MSRKYSLKWNDFNSHVRKAFTDLRYDNHFCDVTLVSDDLHEFSAHKVVLSTCSDYFKNLLRNNKNPHPNVCMEGLNCQELKNVIDYIYTGEIVIEKCHIKKFVSTAKRLRLAGLDREDKPLDKQVISKIDDNVKPEERKELSNDDKEDLLIDDDAGRSTIFDFQSNIEVSNDQQSRVILPKKLENETVTAPELNDEKKESNVAASENNNPISGEGLYREYSNRTLYNEELLEELSHINFTRSVTPETNIYDCNTCKIRYFTFFEAKEHFEQEHQNVVKEKEIIIEMMTFMRNLKKQMKTEKPQETSKKFPNLSSEMKNRISTLKEISDMRLNENLRIKKAKLLSWFENRVFNFYNFAHDK